MIGASSLARSQANAERSLTATVSISRGTAPATQVAGKVVPGATVSIYVGPASINASAKPRTVEEGGEVTNTGQWLMRLPVTAATILPGDKVTVTTPGTLADPTMPTTLYVVDVDVRTIEVLRRVWCTTKLPGSVAA